MNRLARYLGAAALLILAGGAQAANMPGPGSCGPRSHFLQWMKDAHATSPGYSIVDVRDPYSGEIIAQFEMSFWSNADGDAAVAKFDLHDDPQGEIAFGCIVLFGSGQQPAPILVPRKGA